MKKNSTDWISLGIILVFSTLAMKALFHSGLYTAHDIWHQVVRLYYYSQAINDNQFPPLWIGQLANDFGYPLFFFSYHFPWIIGDFLMKLGIGLPEAIKILFFLSYLGSGITMYFFVLKLLKNKLSALISSLLYLWLPYHFLIIFVSASMGIAFIFTFLPLVLLGIHLIKDGSRFGIPILSLGLFGIILSHIIHLIFLSPLIVIFFFWEFNNSSNKFKLLKNTLFGLILAALLSSFYLIPATYYTHYTRAQQATGLKEIYKRHFINFNQLVYSKWNFSPIVNNAKDGEVSFQLGIAHWISILALTLLIIFRKISKPYLSLGIYMLVGFVISIFLMLDFSKPIWETLVKVAAVDFPFRLLLPAAFIASLSAGIILANFNNKLKYLIFIFLLIVAFYTNRNHLNVNEYTNFPIKTYLAIETEVTTNTFNEYLPLKANDHLLGKPWNEAIGEEISTSNPRRATNFLAFTLNAKKEATVSAGQFYFPGQILYVDGKINPFEVDKEGRINFKTISGNHDIIIKFEGTLITGFSKILTLIGFSVLMFLLLNVRTLSK